MTISLQDLIGFLSELHAPIPFPVPHLQQSARVTKLNSPPDRCGA
jgi:hypothetical protein